MLWKKPRASTRGSSSIDGERLAELMIDYEAGVQPEAVVTLYRLDEDFFQVL